MWKNNSGWKDNDCCRDELNIDKLCANCVKSHQLKSKKITAEEFCSDRIEAKNLFAEDQVVNNLCVPGKFFAKEAWADKSYTNTFCAQFATFDNACISNLNVGNLTFAAKYRASVTLNADTTYTLGTNINWNIVLDDPNGNVALAPFTYTVPASGYYSLSYYINSDTLTGAQVIVGVPVGFLTVTVNNNILRQFQSPYLSFSALQTANLSSLVLLNAGDVIRMKYEVLVLDPVLGQIPYVGTVSLKGNGTFPEKSGFSIHFLSALNQATPITCPPCPTVTIPCELGSVSCEPCNPCGPRNHGY